METMEWTLHNEVPSQSGNLSFTTPSGVPMQINNLKSNIMIFTDYHDVLEVRVLSDSVSGNTVIVMSSKIKESASKQTSQPEEN
jgi:hypothetical protein